MTPDNNQKQSLVYSVGKSKEGLLHDGTSLYIVADKIRCYFVESG